MRDPTTSTPIVELRDVVVRYGPVTAVDGVTLAVPRGGLTALVGPSGCGKTTLLRALAGFEVPVAGEILVAGRKVSGDGTWVPPEQRHMGMVFQQGALFPHKTVTGNVLYGLNRRDNAQRRAREVLELVGMVGFEERYPDELSGGQQQRVALARALAPEPRVVLLDEPFGSLDAALRARLREEVRRILAVAGATGILVTHDQEEAFSVADTVAVMEAGRLLQSGSPEDIYRRPASLAVARFLGDGQLLEAHWQNGVVGCPLGQLEVELEDTEPGNPPAHLLVRPEDLTVAPPEASTGVGAPGEIVGRRFFGHDVLDEVRLGSGQVLAVRHLSSALLPVGSQVRLALRPGPLALFAEDGRSVGTALPEATDVDVADAIPPQRVSDQL